MKTISTAISFCFLLVLTSQSLVAQTTEDAAFGLGTKVVNIHLGLGSTLYSAGFKGTFPPIAISYEQGIADGKWGVGGYISRTGSKWGDGEDWWKYSYTTIGARGAYHFYTTDKLDTYGGLMLGYNIVSSKWSGSSDDGYRNFKASSSGVGYAIFVGGRYYFSDNIGVSAELGYGIAVLSLGASIKF